MSSCCSGKREALDSQPKQLYFKSHDYIKAFICWLNSFKKTFDIEPCLYYTGKEYNKNTPLLVTCNYHLTVFLLWRIVRKQDVRILVIDTKGINVWCSSGKGQFNADEIVKQLKRYSVDIISGESKLELILPKLSLSGVSLAKLRQAGFIPRIGPIYMKQILNYLQKQPLKDQIDDKYKFSLKDRLFILPVSVLQFLGYVIVLTLFFFIMDYFYKRGIFWQPLLISFILAVLYILLFPILPSRLFSIKGLSLGIILSSIILVLKNALIPHASAILFFYLLFTLGISLWFGLYFTGNSGVSNYSLVKKEIIYFMPVAFIVLLASIIIFLIP